MHNTIVTVQGRMVADPELRTSKTGGFAYCTFRIATTPRRPVAGQAGTFEDGETSYYKVVAFRNLGANVLASLHKGEPVIVTGRLRITEFQREDQTWGMSADITADMAGHDLSWGQSAFTKVSKPSYGSGDPTDHVSESDDFGGPGTGQASHTEANAGYVLVEEPAA